MAINNKSWIKRVIVFLRQNLGLVPVFVVAAMVVWFLLSFLPGLSEYKFDVYIFVLVPLFGLSVLPITYDYGRKEGYNDVVDPPEKIVEIQDTWFSNIQHAVITIIAVIIWIWFAVFLFPWCIAYYLGKRRGRIEAR